MFLDRYSSELKFMDPWAQEDIYVQNTPRILGGSSIIKQIESRKVKEWFKKENES